MTDQKICRQTAGPGPRDVLRGASAALVAACALHALWMRYGSEWKSNRYAIKPDLRPHRGFTYQYEFAPQAGPKAAAAAAAR